MPTNRRTLLAASGAALVLVAAGGVWRVLRVPETATDPWDRLATPEPDIRLDAFRHAILAPNPHNRQPWIIRLDGADGATIFCDLGRRLPHTDPFDRQITIGFGCFLELARIAAAQRGLAVAATPFPEGTGERLDRRPVARLQFAPGAVKDPLFAQIPARRSNKEAFDMARPLAAQTLAEVVETAAVAAGHTTDPQKVQAIRAQVLKAIDIEMHLPRTNQESVDLMRIGAREVDANPDGIDLHGPLMEALAATGQISRAALADSSSSAFRSGVSMMHETYGAAPGFLWLTTVGNDRATQLAAGAAYARLNLASTANGLSMHPMSQSLQEFPEMAGPYAAIHGLLAKSGERVQMLARIGHGPTVPPAPRWPLETRLAQPL
jgi:hypothetical protein